jgi:hypothetical protein
MDELETLKARLGEANKAVVDIERDQRAAIDAAKAKVLAEFSAPLQAARMERAVAEKAKRDYIEANASHPWDGKKVFRIRKRRIRPYSREMVEYREEGFVEVVRTTSQFPENLSSYSMPELGSIIVRKVKKDGSPAKAFIERYWPQNADRMTNEWKLA